MTVHYNISHSLITKLCKISKVPTDKFDHYFRQATKRYRISTPEELIVVGKLMGSLYKRDNK